MRYLYVKQSFFFLIDSCFKQKNLFVFIIFLISIWITFGELFNERTFIIFCLINIIRAACHSLSVKNRLIYVANYDILSEQIIYFTLLIICICYVPFILFMSLRFARSYINQKNVVVKYWLYVYFVIVFSLRTAFVLAYSDFGYSIFRDAIIPNEVSLKRINLANFIIFYIGGFADFYWSYRLFRIITLSIIVFPVRYSHYFLETSFSLKGFNLRRVLYCFIAYFVFTYKNEYNFLLLPFRYFAVETYFCMIRFFIILKIISIKVDISLFV